MLPAEHLGNWPFLGSVPFWKCCERDNDHRGAHPSQPGATSPPVPPPCAPGSTCSWGRAGSSALGFSA